MMRSRSADLVTRGHLVMPLSILRLGLIHRPGDGTSLRADGVVRPNSKTPRVQPLTTAALSAANGVPSKTHTLDCSNETSMPQKDSMVLPQRGLDQARPDSGSTPSSWGMTSQFTIKPSPLRHLGLIRNRACQAFQYEMRAQDHEWTYNLFDADLNASCAVPQLMTPSLDRLLDEIGLHEVLLPCG